MNKKGIALSFLVTLVLGFLIFGSTAILFSRCYRLSAKGLESYGALVGNIQAMEKRVEGEIEVFTLIMDKETAIIGFTKESERAVCSLPQGADRIFERPTQCEENKSCLCLCRKGFKLESSKYICETSILCNSFENIDFPSKITKKNFGLFYPTTTSPGPYPVTYSGEYEFSGGFIFVREFGSFPRFQTREAAVYLERYKEGVALCFDSPCFK